MMAAKRAAIGGLGIIVVAIIAVGVVLYAWEVFKHSETGASGAVSGPSQPPQGT
jgi:hypothetical protein